jgi:hypothetical protein
MPERRSPLSTPLAAYIRSRSTRHPDPLDLLPVWTLQMLADDRLVELTPCPTSRDSASGLIGYPLSAARVFVIA